MVPRIHILGQILGRQGDCYETKRPIISRLGVCVNIVETADQSASWCDESASAGQVEQQCE